MQKSSLLTTDGIILATWALMSLIFGFSLLTGPYTLTEQIIFFAITGAFGSFLLYALVFNRAKPSLQTPHVLNAEEQKRS